MQQVTRPFGFQITIAISCQNIKVYGSNILFTCNFHSLFLSQYFLCWEISDNLEQPLRLYLNVQAQV